MSVCAAGAALLLVQPAMAQQAEAATYQPNEASLSRHSEVPEWFRDAKLGIYVHWGVYSVPADRDEWYPRWMHFREYASRPEIEAVYQRHVERYGPPEEFGYHDFVPMFTAENFDADEWADLFVAAGAKFAGLVAEHHDGFAMWDSAVTPWNAADKGPERDVVGELYEAYRERGLKVMGSFHHARNLQRYSDLTAEEANALLEGDNQWIFSDSHYPWIPGQPPTSDDPELRLLYGNVPEGEWLEEIWFAKLTEFIDSYHPDLIYFDSWLDTIPQSYRDRFAAYYFNAARERGQDVMVTHKQEDLPLTWSVEDFEKGRMDRLTDQVWMTDDTISDGSWCYTEDLGVKPLTRVLHDFIDSVSKNGQLLLNVSPMADGTIPDNQRAVLNDLGHWMDRNGEAIYETRPWRVYGEGPTKLSGSGHFLDAVSYTAGDIRFTTKGSDTLYVIALGEPEGDTLTVKSLASDLTLYDGEIASVSLLGGGEVIGWERGTEGLVIPVGDDARGQPALVWKIVRAVPEE